MDTANSLKKIPFSAVIFIEATFLLVALIHPDVSFYIIVDSLIPSIGWGTINLPVR